MLFSIRSVVRLLAVWTVIPAMLLCQVAQPAQPLDKHARKIQKTLASYPPDSTVLVVMREARQYDAGQYLGRLGNVQTTGFELIRRDGEVLKLSYSDVRRVQKADANTGNVVHFRHRHNLLVGVIVVGALVGFIFFAAFELRKS